MAYFDLVKYDDDSLDGRKAGRFATSQHSLILPEAEMNTLNPNDYYNEELLSPDILKTAHANEKTLAAQDRVIEGEKAAATGVMGLLAMEEVIHRLHDID